MVFKEEAYKEVFPDVAPAPVVAKQESMINDQDDDRPAEEPKQVEQAQEEPAEEPKQESMTPDQEEGA